MDKSEELVLRWEIKSIRMGFKNRVTTLLSGILPHRLAAASANLAVLTLSLCAVTGCSAPGVGDPCIPERIADGGFNQQEVYLETSSLQCRTQVCMVYQLSGNPAACDETSSVDGSEVNCSTKEGSAAWDEEVNSRVYCTCRCDGPEDVTESFCSCPSGFRCEKLFDLESRPGLKGSYCVDDRTPRRAGT